MVMARLTQFCKRAITNSCSIEKKKCNEIYTNYTSNFWHVYHGL